MRYFFSLLLLIIGVNTVVFGATPVGNAKQEKSSTQDGKKNAKQDEKNYSLRFAWWEMPAEIPDLYILSGNKYISIAPRQGSMSPEVGVNSNGTVELLKKLVSTEKDNTGKPKESYEIYASINLTQLESHELGILLIPTRQKNVVGSRVYDFSTRGFPFGSFITVNFTPAKITCMIDDNHFTVPPNGFTKSPKLFTERTIASIGMIASDPSGSEMQIASTKIVFNETMRTIYFVIPSNGVSKYDVRCIIDIDSNPTKSSDTKGNSDESKGKNSKSKAS